MKKRGKNVDEKLLEKSAEEEQKGVLELAGETTKRVRKNKSKRKNVESASSNDDESTRGDSETSVHLSSMRQSELRKSETPLPGNTRAEHEGYGSERKVGGPSVHDQMQTRAPLGASQYSAEQNGGQILLAMPPNKTKKIPAETERKVGIQLNSEMLPMPRNANELATYLETVHKGGGFPSIFDTPAKRIAAYNLGRALKGDKWQLAVNNIAIIEGKMCIFGDLPGGLAQDTGEVAEKICFVVDEELKKICLENKNLKNKPYAGICIMARKGHERNEFFFTIDEARAIGKYPGKENGAWNKHTKTMLMRRAMGQAIKFIFPEALLGTPIAEHEFHLAPDLEEVNQSTAQDMAADLNKTYDSKDPKTITVTVTEQKMDDLAKKIVEETKPTEQQNAEARKKLALEIMALAKKNGLTMEVLGTLCNDRYKKKMNEMTFQEMQDILVVLTEGK